MANSNVLYIEPNYTFHAPNPNGVDMYNIVPTSPPMEDYCVVVDLEVEVPVRPLYGEVKSSDTVLHVRYSSSMDGNSRVSFNQGRKYPGSDNYYLTTEPNEMGTFYDISRDDKNTAEMFGINSITIEYQSYMVPVVTIKFTDIRGLSLFGAEDLRHNVTSSNGIKYSINDAIAGSFFKCFFTFPYPRFKIMVKGFYGNPVSYELTCSDFRANFDSTTGNFGATAKFVGYSFSVLNDLTMTSLLASPRSEYFGKKYWEDNANKFVFDDGKPMIPLLDVIERADSILKELSRINKDSEIDKLQETLNKILQVKNAHERYFNVLSRTIRDNGGKNGVYIIGSKYRLASSFQAKNDELENAYSTLENAIASSNITFNKPTKFGVSTSSISNLKDAEYYESDNNEVRSKFDTLNEYYAYDGSLLKEKTDSLEFEYNRKIEVKQSELDKERNDKIENAIGFKPSVKNITELILAHIETFVNEIYECAKNVSRLPKNGDFPYRIDNKNDSAFYAFPTVTKKVIDNKTSKQERTWIGEYDLTSPEAQLVEKLLMATNEAFAVTNKVKNNIETSTSETRIKVNVAIPAIPCDFLGNTNPYTNISINDNYDLCGKILARALVVENSVICKNNYMAAIKEIGIADASNFYKNNPKVTSEFRYKISDNGTFTSTNIINLLLNNNSKLSDNKEPIWKTKDHQSKAILKLNGSSYECDYFQNKVKTICSVPVGRFEWDELSSIIESSTVKQIDKEDYYTQGFNEKNENLFKIEKDWETYNAYSTIKPTGNLETLNSLYNLSINGENFVNFYDKIIDNKSMISNKLSVMYPNFNFDDNMKYPSLLPLSITNNLSSNKPLLCDSDSSEVIITDSEGNKIEYKTAKKSDLSLLYNSKGNMNNYTINYFCGYDDGDISNITSIFGQVEYYNTLSQVSEEAAALMFLNTFKWDYNQLTSILESQNMNYIPYLFAIAIGGYFYRMDNKNKFNYIKLNNYSNDFNGYKCDYDETIDDNWFNDFSKRFINIRKEIKEEFKSLFIDWVSTDFKEINNQLGIKLKNTDTYSSPSDFIVKFVDKYKKNKNTFLYPSQVISELRNVLQDNFFTNYQMIQCCVNTNNNSLKLFNRENSDIVKEITKQLLSPCLMINSIKTPVQESTIYSSNDRLQNINLTTLRVYIDGFIEGLKKNCPEENTSTESEIESFKTHEQIKIALYNYLKIIWDRWLSGNPKTNGKTKWDLSELKDRWHYLDSFYNKLTDKATINIFDFIKDITNSYDTIGASALSVMSSTYARSRFVLMCVQNFASLIDDKLMKDMFKPIPYNQIDPSMIKSVPDFIVMYTNEPSSKLDIESSEYTNDSFMIGGDDMQLPIPILTKNKNNGHKIPAFGVTYGGQYQSYFTNIQVGMENPQVTDQSLQAQFEIVKKLDSNEAIAVGQDLFTIYSNQSFTCTVNMLGCAWVQPLMYFQLNNIPMFKGSYLIQKVTHNISPGKMETTFTGTRMSSMSTPFVDNGLIIKPNSQTGLAKGNSDETNFRNANIYNNCKYKYFNPLYESDGNGMTTEELDMSVNDYGLNHGGWKFELPNKNDTMRVLFGKIAYGEVGDADELSVKTVLSVLFNRYKSAGSNFCKVLFNNKQHAISDTCPDRFLGYIDEIFTKTPIVLVGEQTSIKKQVPIWNNFTPSGQLSKPKALTEHDVKSMDAYCTTNGYDTNFRNPRNIHNTGDSYIPLEPIPPSKNAYWHKGEYLFQHDRSKKLNGHVFVSTGWLSKKSGTEHWKLNPIQNSNKNNQYPSQIAKNLFESIKKTAEYSNNVSINNLKMEGINANNKDTIKITCTPTSGMAQVFDIVLNTYYDHFSELHWVVNNGGGEFPAYIQVNASDSPNKIIAVSSYNSSKNNKVSVLPQYKNLNNLFYIALQKKYGDLSNKTAFKTECRNFVEITNKQSWEDEVKSLLSHELIDCAISENATEQLTSDSFIIESNKGFTWDGSNSQSNKIAATRPSNNTFSPADAVNYIVSRAYPRYDKNTCGKCAKFVREAIMSNNGGNLQLKNWPLSACCYVKHLPYWGFNVVYSGVAKEPMKNYTPKNGDIAVIAGSTDGKTSIHGHIQIYSSDKNAWYSDYPDKDAWCYNSPNGRPFKIFRWNGFDNKNA